MGYLCPVCEAPQPDGEHLANHLAFTGLFGDEAHEAWLDEHVPDWGERDPAALGEAVTAHVEPTEIEGVGSDDHDHAGRPEVSGAAFEDADLDPAAEAALEEAREMTRQLRGENEEEEG